ncbi:hypothetical protein [Paraclostridium sordellii]|uniref:hypothetical protein n=1 Tax=Paraclostridium sordellii TaxID=1505 RepID=UPI0012D72016|nr:hypothetical protein [Paeniclostridium sordellii]
MKVETYIALVSIIKDDDKYKNCVVSISSYITNSMEFDVLFKYDSSNKNKLFL